MKTVIMYAYVNTYNAIFVYSITISKVVRLREMFTHGPGIVLVFDYMLSDLSQVIRNMDEQLTEVG